LIKRNSNEKEVNLSLFANDTILYLRDAENSTKKFLDIKVSSLSTYQQQTEKQYRKTIPFTIASKNRIPRNKLNKESERPLQ
jgi:hypothetical protein